MARTAVGLDIGTSGVRAAQLTMGKGPVTLERFGQVALPPGAVRDGEVADIPTVAAAIKQLWASAKFSSKKVVLGVANQRVIVRQVDLPWMPASELRASLPLQVQEMVPMPIEQAVLDFHPVEEFVNDAGARMQRITLVAAAREMVMASLQAAQQAGLTVTQVELTPFAVLRSLATVDQVGADPSMHATAEALVDIGAKVTNIVVHQNGAPKFVRILLMGGDTITDAVAERMGMPFEEAEALKHQHKLGQMPGVPASDHPATRVVETVGSAFIDEVRGSLDYYLAQAASQPLRRIVVSGGGARLGGLAERLALATRLPVQPAAVLSGVRMGKTGLTPEQLQYVEPLATVPLGLALGVAA